MCGRRTARWIGGPLFLGALVLALGISPAPARAAAKKFEAFSALEREMRSFSGDLGAVRGQFEKAGQALELKFENKHKAEDSIKKGSIGREMSGSPSGLSQTPNLTTKAGAGGPQINAVVIQGGIQKLRATLERMQASTKELEADFVSLQGEGRLSQAQNLPNKAGGGAPQANAVTDGIAALRKLQGQLDAIGGGLNTLRKAGGSQQQLRAGFEDVNRFQEGAQQILIGLLLPAVEKVREAAASPAKGN